MPDWEDRGISRDGKILVLPGEAVFGFGEKFGSVNKAGQTIDLTACDALGVTTPRSYKNVPFFMSTRGYGAFFNTSCRMRFPVGSRGCCDLQAVADDGRLDYFLFFGTRKEILGNYVALTGHSPVPPDWSFGFWQSKISYRSAAHPLIFLREGALIPLIEAGNTVNAAPVERFRILAGRLTEPGERMFSCRIGGDAVELRYRFDGREHRVTACGAAVPYDVKMR